ncbi:hypothetical protein [Streptomyces sp. NBC_00503]|uniref:hypothetical protein n=1 Tax=Streptomyces sp. NBC_00503 TaxID=2903659 RepID=UPI002E808452|nr:hypothetical protein [Streptomyces sp. NBC_00503]WUD85330.1 hypothetical protein OG490_34830 [Streptomyces sp. NBC_00503]
MATLLSQSRLDRDTTKATPGGSTPTSGSAAAPAPSKAAADAASAFGTIGAAVPSAKLGGTVTAENDVTHLLTPAQAADYEKAAAKLG